MRSWTMLLLVGCGSPVGHDDAVDTDAAADTDVGDSDTHLDSDAYDTDADTDAADTDVLVDTTCPGWSPGAATTCTVSTGTDGALLLVGTLLTPDGVLRGGKVAVDAAGTITCVGCDCAATDATVVTCPSGVVSPGLINPHDHLTFDLIGPASLGAERYEDRDQWRRGLDEHTTVPSTSSPSTDEVSWAELRHLMAGTTSIAGSGGSAGLVRNLDKATLQEGLAQGTVRLDTFPLGNSSGPRAASGCAYPNIRTSTSIQADDAYLPHLGEGIDAFARNELACASSDAGGGQDLITSRTAVVLGTAFDANDLAVLAADGAGLIWSPRSNLALYGDTAVVTAARRLGVPVALGTDWLVTGSMNLLRELRCADSFDATWLDDTLTDVDLWRMVTADAAAVTGTDDAIGALRVGAVADVAVFQGATHADHRAVLDADPQDVLLVLRGGRALYGEADAMAALDASGTLDALDVCGASRALALVGELGKTLAQLGAATSGSYPLFACGVPANEPTCVPSRPGASVDGGTVYQGAPTAGDADGDGIPDATDACPRVFDPARPGTGGHQADVDQDGVGDACDPCPVEAGLAGCP